MPIFLGLETLALIALKGAFGKAVVGTAVKTGVGLVGKALVVHDVVSTVSHLADASAAVDFSGAADPSTIHGGPEVVNGHGNTPTDIHGNDVGRTGHGQLPTDIHGTPRHG